MGDIIGPMLVGFLLLVAYNMVLLFEDVIAVRAQLQGAPVRKRRTRRLVRPHVVKYTSVIKPDSKRRGRRKKWEAPDGRNNS